MKKSGLLLSLVVISGLAGSFTISFAADPQTPASIAQQNGTFEEFKKERLELKKEILNQRVKDGVLTQTQADDIYKQLEENMATCDGSGSAKIGQKNGLTFGNGSGNCNGCNGQGQGLMMKNGNGLRNK